MKRLSWFFVIGAFYSGIAYLVTESWLCAVGIMAAFSVVLTALEISFFRKAAIRGERKKECTAFTRSFALSLLATGSLNDAYKAALGGVSKNSLKEISAMEVMGDKLKTLESLSTYFKEDFYELFLSVTKMAVEEGGDITILAQSFLFEADERERDEIRRDGARKKALGEFVSLSFLGSLILAFLRFSLSGFYQNISGNSLYVTVAIVYFLFCLVATALFCFIYFDLNLSNIYLPRTKHEKNKKSAQKANR